MITNILLVLLLTGETVRDKKIYKYTIVEMVPGRDSGGDDLARFIDLDRTKV